MPIEPRPDQRRTASWGAHPPPLLAALIIGLATAPSVGAQPALINDPADAVIRRTDYGACGAINPATQRLPDLVQLRHGRFAPANPATDLCTGAWSNSGGFMRIDLVLAGLVNPPGLLGYDDESPQYDPFKYGPNPVFGWVEFDADGWEETGGDRYTPELRYTGNAGRWGGAPSDPRFAGRIALDYDAFDSDASSPPFVDRSGEEFHIALLGEEITGVTVVTEAACGNPQVFEAGETWSVQGHLWHRAHSFEPYILTCWWRKGQYKPLVQLRFAHNTAADRTTISLVYPLTNPACASWWGGAPAEANDGCDGNQHSIDEALSDLQFSAMYADPWDQAQPEFQVLAGWEFNTPAACIDPATWRNATLLGTAYGTAQSGGARFIWTDVWPNPRCGDFNGDGQLTSADVSMVGAYVTDHDGELEYDDDENGCNQSIEIHAFSARFCAFDTDYDGFVLPTDGLLAGDMDIDLALTAGDVDDLVQALLEPAAYSASHGGTNPLLRGDMNADGLLNGDDVGLFVAALLGP